MRAGYTLTEEMDHLTVEEAQRDYAVVWATAHEMLPDLSDEQLAAVVSIATQICSACHESTWPCHCMNDD